MELCRTSGLLLLASRVSSAEAFSATDPVVCYLLDVILLLYSVIFTALFFRQKFTKEEAVPVDPATPARNPNEPVYTDLDLPQISSDYQTLDSGIRRREPETHYQELRTNTSDIYQHIGTKPRKAKKKTKEGRTARQRDETEAVEMEIFPTTLDH